MAVGMAPQHVFDSKYDGWKNWENWNVALWINNEESSYREMRAKRPFTPQKAKLFVSRIYPGGTPDMKGDRRTTFPLFLNVDWRGIAEDFNSD
jgi:hypothetical protein